MPDWISFLALSAHDLDEPHEESTFSSSHHGDCGHGFAYLRGRYSPSTTVSMIDHRDVCGRLGDRPSDGEEGRIRRVHSDIEF